MRTRFFLPVFLVALGVAAPAFAGERSDDPAAEKARGDAAMDGYRLDEALEAYSHAYELGHDPALLYNRGRVHQARSEWTKALGDLEAFDRDASPELKAKVPKLVELIASVRAHVHTLAVQCNVEGAHVFVRGADLGATPLAPQRVDAGGAQIRVEAPDYTPFTKDVDLAGGASSKVDVQLVKVGVPAPIIVAAPAPKEKKPITREWWFWTGVGVVAVAAVVTVVLVANTEKSPADGTSFSPGRVSGPLTISW